MGYIDPNETEVFPACQGLRETERAVLVRLASGDEKWIPKSVIHADSEVYNGETEGQLIVKAWFVEKEGLNPGAQRAAAARPLMAPRFPGDVRREPAPGELSMGSLPVWTRRMK